VNRYLISAVSLLFATNASVAADVAPASAPTSAPTATTLVSGIDRQNIDPAVRVQDNFYQHINGTWLKNTQIGDLYASFMDEQKLDAIGLKSLDPEFALVASLKDKKLIPALIAHFNQIGITAPYEPNIHQDNKDSTKYIVDFGQSGLGLPDRDYYLENDAKMKDARVKYQAYIEKMLSMTGDKDAASKAKEIVALETALAKVQWTKVQNRDPVKAYNKIELPKLNKLTPDYDWKPYLTGAGLDGKLTYVIVSQPSYLTGFSKVVKTMPLSAWKSYFAWHVLNSNASYLSKAYSDEHFAFYGTTLNGVPEQQVRWKRAVGLEEGAIGEGLGKLYVAQYFPPENKSRMEKLVANLLEAYRRSIDTLDWMGPATKKEAQAKLASLVPKIGYPSKWRDYSSLAISKDDLIGNVERANRFEYQRNVNKLGQPIDRTEWDMTPQTVNAYYNPELNEVVFPAAILQPPFFNVQADDAVNYGAIGAVIGHEMSHGFDDQGAQYDDKGNLRDWWTKEDHKNFATKTAALIKQYNAYSPLPGYHVNGELTLGENIADNSGLAIAYKAYKLSLGGKEAPVIDGLTGDQRFYLGFGQVWRAKVRENAIIVRLKTDPHSPPEFRGNGVVKNQPNFYSAFDVKEGDGMYLPPDQRVIMW
jgi:putative endopeptidase